MRSKGADTFSFVPIKTADFRWDVNVGYSFNNESRVLKVTDDAKKKLTQSKDFRLGDFCTKGSAFSINGRLQ